MVVYDAGEVLLLIRFFSDKEELEIEIKYKSMCHHSSPYAYTLLNEIITTIL